MLYKGLESCLDVLADTSLSLSARGVGCNMKHYPKFYHDDNVYSLSIHPMCQLNIMVKVGQLVSHMGYEDTGNADTMQNTFTPPQTQQPRWESNQCYPTVSKCSGNTVLSVA